MANSKDELKQNLERTSETVEPINETVWRKIKKAIKRSLLVFLLLILSYLGIALLGLIPVNNDFVETENGIEIFVFSGEFHSDLILPIKTDVIDWKTQFDSGHVTGDTIWATHMKFGWGDHDFYIHTPSWSDLKVSTATNALLIPSKTVMHVSYDVEPEENSSVRGVTISKEQYQRLVDFVLESFATNDQGDFELIVGKSYHQCDAFYRANGSYHCFKTCNCWAGKAIKTAGIKTGWFTPFPKTPFLYFPE